MPLSMDGSTEASIMIVAILVCVILCLAAALKILFFM